MAWNAPFPSFNQKAVCYLNDHGKDYKGGILQFQDGEPSFITPVAGDVVIYTADNSNTHCVDEVHFCFLHGPVDCFCTGFMPILFIGIVCHIFCFHLDNQQDVSISVTIIVVLMNQIKLFV
jgi:hypothetical protein